MLKLFKQAFTCTCYLLCYSSQHVYAIFQLPGVDI